MDTPVRALVYELNEELEPADAAAAFEALRAANERWRIPSEVVAAERGTENWLEGMTAAAAELIGYARRYWSGVGFLFDPVHGAWSATWAGGWSRWSASSLEADAGADHADDEDRVDRHLAPEAGAVVPPMTSRRLSRPIASTSDCS